MNTKNVIGWTFWLIGFCMIIVFIFMQPKSFGFPEPDTPPLTIKPTDTTNASINNLWVTIALILVALMQPGFAFLESGLIRSGNTVNVLFKNTIDFCLNGFVFFFVGYSLMWNGSFNNFQFHGIFVSGWLPTDFSPNGIVGPIHFLFQMVFATTAATISSGLVAGRIKISAYFIITIFIGSIIYPISGFWAWCADANGPVGFLNKMGYHDLAGSSVVHVVGGFAGLAGAILLGPRLGRYHGDPELYEIRKKHFGKISSLPGFNNYDQGIHKPHSFTSATLGTFLLWIGWFGFNGGSVLAMSDGSEKIVGHVLINTMMAACGGGITGALAPYVNNVCFGKGFKIYSIDGLLNGILGGLVAITAGCDLFQNPVSAVIIGMISGLLVYLTSTLLNNLPSGWKIDDPVGAFGVHGVCGVFGILCCAFANNVSFITQSFGCILIASWAFCSAFFVFWSLKSINRLRSTPEDEISGFDAAYHRQSAYTLE